MLENDLLALIKKGEGAKLEFKRDDIRPENLAREIVAFANTNGGKILMGVEDNGNISGITRPDLQTWIMDTVVGRFIEPIITVDYDEVTVNNKKMAVVSVPMGAAKPYALRHNDRTDFYVRRGNTCQLASAEEMLRLFESGGRFSIEKMSIDGCTPDQLNKLMVKSYFIKAFDYTEEDWENNEEQILLNHDFIVKIEYTDKKFVSYFACALFAKNPCRYLPQAGIRLIVYKNNRDDEERDAIMDEILDMSFFGIDEKHHIWKLTELYIKPHISREHLDAEVSFARQTLWDYPIEVVRELVINAFTHRDWLKQNQIEITIYNDCMEITSPGPLPNGMTVEKVKAGERVARNNKILDILRDTKFVEARGMGIRRRVIPIMQKHNGCEPIFEPSDNYFRVILPKRSNG